MSCGRFRDSDCLVNPFFYNYLNGDVIHYEVSNEGHGASRAIGEKILLEFLEGDSVND